MFTSAIKKTFVCCSISLNSYMVRKAILLLVYIADVTCLTNRSFYMQTLSLRGFSLGLLFFKVSFFYWLVWTDFQKSKYSLYSCFVEQ